MVKNLKEILSILCVLVMTATVFSAVITNVLADEEDSKEKTMMSLNPDVAVNKPVITVTSPKGGETIEWVEEGTRVWINGTAYSTNPDTTILKVEIKIGIRGWAVVNGTTNWSYLWDLTQLTQADWAATNYTGNFTIFARAWDGYSYSEYYKLTVHYIEPGGLYSNPLWDILAYVVLSVFSIICLVIVALHVLRVRKFRKEHT